MSQFPGIGEYNQTIQKYGGNAFRSLKGINIIPSRTVPIKVFLFGSGSFAVVFKGSYEGKNYALRCFLTADQETLERYQVICHYLRTINSAWLTSCEYLEQEIEVKGARYPVLKMEWVNGMLINNFVSANLSAKEVLGSLQEKLISLSKDMERNRIGHGDLQSGNIIVTGTGNNFDLRLIDYDGMYVPGLEGRRATERGRSEFQHPKRTLTEFSPKMDRFSIWVMVTALEAVKLDESLWKEVLQGGYNTLDNFLFTAEDFLNPRQSKLFQRLWSIDAPSLNFFLTKLTSFCTQDVSAVEEPTLFESQPTATAIKSQSTKSFEEQSLETDAFKRTSKFLITSNTSATILTTSFKKMGTTPMELERKEFEGKTLVVVSGDEVREIKLESQRTVVALSFVDPKQSKPSNSAGEPSKTLSSRGSKPLINEPMEPPVYDGHRRAQESIEESRKERMEGEFLQEQKARVLKEQQDLRDRELWEKHRIKKAAQAEMEKDVEKIRKAKKEEVKGYVLVFSLSVILLALMIFASYRKEDERVNIKYSPPTFLYRTNNEAYYAVMRERPTYTAPVVQKVPKGETIYVLEHTTKSYYKVNVNGVVGYISVIFFEEN